ncbi:porin family protein [Saprospira sp. CCB-QB6]|uniref:porin family protein n=1 Tax=Saprospira sp. CCB-QB6 TaxID=3023936 RepID=UPI00234AABBE|nr:porin family protein [Saprospira sp. CCB-QB6]WCL82679.1 porin family protein [Saprospira sp. CCB-QB6]
MLRKITLLTAFLAFVVSAQAQKEFKFGVYVEPSISFFASNDKDVEPDGSNVGFTIGLLGEYYFGNSDNYALIMGGNFSLGRGGSLFYEDGGRLFPDSELDVESYTVNGTGVAGTDGDDILLNPNTKVKYKLNYLEIPVGLKLRTNELGESYMRAFFQLPVLTIGIPVSARASIETAENNNFSTTEGNTYYTPEKVKGENVYKDIFPLQIQLGAGAGVEYSPNEEGGLLLTAGLFYNYAFLDAVGTNQLFNASNVLEDNKARTGFHNIGLRIGIVF